MCMYVYMYICMSIYMYICMSIYMYVCMCLCMYASMCVLNIRFISTAVTFLLLVLLTLGGGVYYVQYFSCDYVHFTQLNQVSVSIDSKNTDLSPDEHYICNVDTGRLGNQMFSYASSYGIAKDKNMTMVVLKNRMLNDYFVLDAVQVNASSCENTTQRNLNVCCTYNKMFLNFTPDTNYRIGMYLQSWKYFLNHIAAIRRQFTFKKEILVKARKFMDNITEERKRRTSSSARGDNPILVGVHIRRGDINSARLRLGFTLAPKTYIIKAMDYFTKKFSNVIFLICSDSMYWVKNNFNSTNIFYSEGNSPEVDLSILASCNHSVMTVGTFGWWGSFLAGGETVYYKHASRDGSWLRKQYSSDYSDYFYPGWIGMD